MQRMQLRQRPFAALLAAGCFVVMIAALGAVLRHEDDVSGAVAEGSPGAETPTAAP